MTFLFNILVAATLATQPALPRIDSTAARMDADAPIAILFAPPVGESVRYRFTRSSTAGHRDVSMVVAFRFQPEPDGYRLTVTHELPPGTESQLGAALLTRPHVLHLGPRGEMLRMESEDLYWTALEEVLERVGGSGSSAARDLVAGARALPVDARLALIAKNYASALQFAGSEWRIREVRTVTAPLETPFGAVPHNLEATLQTVESGSARIVSTATLPPEQFEAIARRMAGATAGSERLIAIERRETSEIEIASGLAQRAEAVVRLEIDTQGRRVIQEQRQVLERIHNTAR